MSGCPPGGKDRRPQLTRWRRERAVRPGCQRPPDLDGQDQARPEKHSESQWSHTIRVSATAVRMVVTRWDSLGDDERRPYGANMTRFDLFPSLQCDCRRRTG